MIYSTEFAIVATTVIGLGIAGFVVHRMIRHVDKRIHLMLRASYHNSRDIKENLETVGVVRTETRKALEHQRVLLSSLNQQIKNLESTISGESFADISGGGFAEKSEFTAAHVPVDKEILEKETRKKIRKEGLLGNLDDFLERGIEQIVANDVRPEKAEKTQVEMPVEPQYVAQETVRTVEEVQQEVQKSVAGAKRGGVISMEKLLEQQKRLQPVQAERTEKIVKLSSIFAHRGRVAHANSGDAGEKKVSVG